jgi:preprotein translocase subunit SecY
MQVKRKKIQEKSAPSGLLYKVLFTIAVLVAYRFGSFIPLPGIDASMLSSIEKYTKNGVFGMFNMLSGGSLARMSIFALTIIPYITSSIVIQLLSSSIAHLKALKQDGEAGQKQINQYTKYLAIIIAFFQGFAIANGIGASDLFMGEVLQGTLLQKLNVALTLATGTMILLWMGERITAKGIGNGISLMIFVGIVAEFPKAFISMFELTRSGSISPLQMMFVLATFVASIVFIILFEKSYRVLKVQQSRQIQRFGGATQSATGTGQLPLKLNPSGVIPPIFSGSVLMLPATIAGFMPNSTNPIIQFIAVNFAHGKPLFIISYLALIYFFTYFYTSIVFDTKEVAANLRKSNTFIVGIRPGEKTQEHIDKVMKYLCFIGATYIGIVCIIPELMSSVYSQFYLIGGTGLLIVVNVGTDTIAQIQIHNLSKKYEKLSQKM